MILLVLDEKCTLYSYVLCIEDSLTKSRDGVLHEVTVSYFSAFLSWVYVYCM